MFRQAVEDSIMEDKAMPSLRNENQLTHRPPSPKELVSSGRRRSNRQRRSCARCGTVNTTLWRGEICGRKGEICDRCYTTPLRSPVIWELTTLTCTESLITSFFLIHSSTAQHIFVASSHIHFTHTLSLHSNVLFSPPLFHSAYIARGPKYLLFFSSRHTHSLQLHVFIRLIGHRLLIVLTGARHCSIVLWDLDCLRFLGGVRACVCQGVCMKK